MDRNYDDIINLHRHISKTRPQMTLEQRSAQFAPFSALTGYEDEIEETGRLVDDRLELDEEMKQDLDRKLQNIIAKKLSATITYFIADTTKDGGKYIKVKGNVKKVDNYKNVIILSDNMEIPINDVMDIII